VRRLAIFPVVLFFSILGSSQVAQQKASRQAPPVAHANDWMRVPTPASSADSVTLGIRMERDRIFDSSIGSSEPLPGHEMAFGNKSVAGPEIPDHPRRAIMIATFTNYRSVWSASRRSVYTELTFHTSHVFQDIKGHAVADEDVTLIKGGGTVQTASGQVFSYMVEPETYSVRPHGIYLLILGYEPGGDFYSELENWDLSDGAVKANSFKEAGRQTRGESTLIGLTKDQVVRLFDDRFGR
jgi:hypothetical protein